MKPCDQQYTARLMKVRKLSQNLLLTIGLSVFASSCSAADEHVNNSGDIERGAYLMKIGYCVACHTAVGGRELAGGLPFETPFGAVYSTNITSDKETGIGKYSYEDFLMLCILVSA